ncbi:acyl carrier protein, partial [Nostoc sp. CHAB 5715]|uniref:acyl carrier protein n=1 Tax=Nostoc sp. CHAB 5715 TaxID=2780400 RepID=UPI001E3E747D
QVSKVLGLPACDSLELKQGFSHMGMDSLMALELKNSLQTSLQHSLPSTLVFDYPSVEVLVEYLAKEVLSLQLSDTELQPDHLPYNMLEQLFEDEIAY